MFQVDKGLNSWIKSSKSLKKYPRVEVRYETGIEKEDYSDWLADQLYSRCSDIFIVPEYDFNLLASTGNCLKYNILS